MAGLSAQAVNGDANRIFKGHSTREGKHPSRAAKGTWEIQEIVASSRNNISTEVAHVHKRTWDLSVLIFRSVILDKYASQTILRRIESRPTRSN
jgi:hypothetical protein